MFTFFSEPKKKALPILPNCGTCGAADKCEFPKQKSIGKPGSPVLVIDSPRMDAADGLSRNPRIENALARFGMSMRDFNVVAASACPKAGEGSWKHCQPLLVQNISACGPSKILVYGRSATQSVISWLWGQNAEMSDRWIGHRIPCRELNAWVCVLGNPHAEINYKVAEIWGYRAMAAALRLEGRPYEKVPNYFDMVAIERNPKIIATALQEAALSTMTAFDYETNCLKPEGRRAKIYSASVAWLEGCETRCIAFPFTDSIRDAWVEYLRSPVPKIAANKCFEERWSFAKLGTRVRKWAWDTVIAAHIADPQKTVAGLKFQAFARLGQSFYAGNVEQYFGLSDADGINSIHLANERELLLYNGIDSIAELDLGILQRYEAGIDSDLWSCNLPDKRIYKFGDVA